MLQVDLRELARGPVETRGELAVGDPLFEGLDFVLDQPVVVEGRLQATGEERFYWQGALRTVVRGECRRCLKPVTQAIAAECGALFSRAPDAQGEADPDAYGLAPELDAVDLRPAVREELILAVPRFLECRADCRGLCPRCGKDLNAGPCGCPPPTDLRWAGLAALKDKFRD